MFSGRVHAAFEPHRAVWTRPQNGHVVFYSASFIVTGHHVSGQVSTITGHFIALVWQGAGGGGGCNCGASTISLTQ